MAPEASGQESNKAAETPVPWAEMDVHPKQLKLLI